MKLQNDDFVANWIEEEGNPAIEKLTKINLEAAGRVLTTLNEKGFDIDKLVQLIDMPAFEVNKWLNGNHNYSEKTLGQIHVKLAEAI